MAAKNTIEKLAQEIDVDYGDIVRREELIDLFGLERALIKEEMSLREIKHTLKAEDWAFMHAMDLFKVYMQEHRKMYLVALGKQGEYRIIRPDEHVEQAYAYLKRTIERGFKEASKILESCRTDLLSSVEKTQLTEAKVKVSTVEHLLKKQSLTNKTIDFMYQKLGVDKEAEEAKGPKDKEKL